MEASRNFPKYMTRFISWFRRRKTADDEVDQQNPYGEPRRRDGSQKKGMRRPKNKKPRTTHALRWLKKLHTNHAPPILAATPNPNAGTSNEGNTINTSEAFEELRLKNQHLVKERSRIAKLNVPDNSLRSMTVVSKHGRHRMIEYTANEPFNWSDQRYISALNRWRQKKLQQYIGPANTRERPTATGVKFTGEEKAFVRKLTQHLVVGQRVESEEWENITSRFNNKRLAGYGEPRPFRTVAQIRKLKMNLDMDDVERPDRRRTRRISAPLMDAKNNAAAGDIKNDDGEGDVSEDESESDEYENDLYEFGGETEEDSEDETAA